MEHVQILRLFIASTYFVGCFCVLFAKFHLPQLLGYGKTLKSSSNFWYNLTCPKSYFTHFYIISLVFSGYNVWVYHNLLAACLMLHSLRRLYESLFITQWGSSKIHAAHYLVGIWFYTVINLSVNICSDKTEFRIISVMIFVFFSLDQTANHFHLSRLRKYSHPSYGLFKYICCAHYFDEVMIYFAFALMNNGTRVLLGYSLLWILINLGTSSYETGNWYLQKFSYRSRWYFIPYIF